MAAPGAPRVLSGRRANGARRGAMEAAGPARALPSPGGEVGSGPGRVPPPAPRSRKKADPPKTAFFLCKQWTLYSVTPLYGFSGARLKDYARLLSAAIAAEKQKGVAVEIGTELDANIKADVSSLPDLKGRNQDHAAILVQLFSRSPTSRRNSENKPLWSGWFCSVSGDDLPESIPKEFTLLPLFLTNGAECYTSLVGSWFQKTFDCCFRRLALSPLNLSWMAVIWTGHTVDRTASAMELVFSVPSLPQPLDISYAIHPEDAKALWDTVHKTPGGITQEEVDVFMDCLYSHFHRHFKIHLSATKLVKVSTAIASAHCSGTIKFLHSEHLTGVLMLLTELARSQI